ncbi:Rrf2 family transcriptional regulator [Marinobacter halodurans]|uniref:Rrf2 family transcriptional regulator n=1 Tax=Marinobacter halodurans TaxID=2528979 RepID=A0ABY1ZPB8_9GAMM|nr:Rrf2 family transcriptional regulator [Marinobacter halodurans]TBW58590.1 Rrf2 family transcriptional regulator [Marinobacter halodurans]
MQLTAHTDYSLRLLIYMAVRTDNEPATVQDVALHYGISAHHVAKVARTLVQLGYLTSHRGRGGGLELTRAPSEINIGEVVRQTENLRLLECFGPNSSCPIEPGCTLKSVLGEALQAFIDVLDRYVLADVVENRQELRGLLAKQAAS